MGELRGGGCNAAVSDLTRVLEDAYSFIRYKNCDFAEFVRDYCWELFAFRRLGCVFYWGRYKKYVRVGPVSIVKAGVSADEKTRFLKIFGIKVFEKPFVL